MHFLPASTTRCLLEPWFRELGFIVCYGSIILKLYRHLVEFRTRKAHRWVLRDVDLLKYLSTMVFAVICYMAAFTASSLDLIQTAGLDGLQEINTNTCQPMKWEFVTQSSEILILAFGLHLAVASRNATTQFRVNLTIYLHLLRYLNAKRSHTHRAGDTFNHAKTFIKFCCWLSTCLMATTPIFIILTNASRFLPPVCVRRPLGTTISGCINTH